MRIVKFLFILFISINSFVIADSKENIINEIKKGGKLIFIRHAHAPGGGDPNNFDINNCSTQRNISIAGKKQSIEIGNFFKKNNIMIKDVYSSKWCRCKDTAKIAFENYEQKNFLNSFFSPKFRSNKNRQIKDFKRFISKWDEKQNMFFVTHYVVISEILDYQPSSGEIVVADKNFNILGNKVIGLDN